MARESTLKKTTDFESMMAVYRELATPGAPHKLLERMVGSWSVKSICYGDPGNPVETYGSSEQKMVLDGRFLLQEFSGEAIGSPFSGIGYTGYDNQKGKYVSTWMDSMGTGIHYFEGTAEADGNTILLTCALDDPIRGSLTWRTVTRIVDDNTIEFTMSTIDKSGKEEKMAEMIYTRK